MKSYGGAACPFMVYFLYFTLKSYVAPAVDGYVGTYR